jgi:hypothetical protein
MTARAARGVWLLAALGLSTLAASSSAGPWTLGKGEYFSETSAGLYSTTSFRNFEGNRAELGYRFESRDFRWANELGWKKHTSFLLEVRGRSVSQVDGGSPSSITQTGLTDVGVGFHQGLINGARGLAVEALWVAPLGYDRELSRWLGDGRQRLGASLAAGTALGHRGFAQGSLGGLYRFLKFGKADSAFSVGGPNKSSAAFLTYSADAGVWVTPRLLVGGSASGQSVSWSSLPDPPFVKNNEDAASRLLVGPVVLLRVDDRLDVKAGTLSTASGKNIYHFNQFWIAFAFKQTQLSRLQGFLGSARP